MLNILFCYLGVTVILNLVMFFSWVDIYGWNFGHQKDCVSFMENFWFNQIMLTLLFMVITIFYLLYLKAFIISYSIETFINLCIIWVLNRKLKVDYSNHYEELKYSYLGAFLPLIGSIYYLLELNEEYPLIKWKVS